MPLVLIIVGGLLFVGGIGYLLFDFDGEGAIGAMLVGIVMVLIGGIWMANIQSDECHRAGGQIVGTGHYYAITTMAGKVPITTIHEVTECRIPTPSN
jgi:hypothetical protein